MADIPFVLAGPILRRITPLNVSVWIALSRPASVKLSIWNKPVDTGTGLLPFDEASNPPLPIHTVRTSTVKIGVKLHVTVANLELAPLNAWLPGALYSYNLSFEGLGNEISESDLKSNALLTDKSADENTFVGHLALGYKPGYLPTFHGETLLWLGRMKRTGRGEGWSNLKFDQLEYVG